MCKAQAAETYLLPCAGISGAMQGILCSVQGVGGLHHGIAEALEGPVPASGTLERKEEALGAPDTAGS